MSNNLRFTGANPPTELWRQYPNWRNALEEEGKDGQDESTLMPHEIQTHIGPFTSFTAGTARYVDGREFPVFLAVIENRIVGCYVYDGAVPWSIYFRGPQKRWLPYRADWLPEAERPRVVSFDDKSIFPLKISMFVPWRMGDVPSVYQISSLGQMSEA